MGKIKIGLIILGLIALVGLVVTGIVMAKNSSDNGKAEYVQDEIIVKFKGDTELFRVIKVPKGQVIEKVRAYQQRADVEYAEPNYLIFALGSNDKYYWNQWALNNIGQEIYSGCTEENCNSPKLIGSGINDADMDWEEAWTAFGAETFDSTVIAIVDSGIDETHPDLNDKLVPGYDFVNNDNGPHDIYGHGTHVAGIAAAETANLEGIAGVAFSANIKIMPVQVLNDDGMGTTANVAKGIMYAADNGAKVINLSLGGGDSTTLKNAVDYAYSKGALLAAAAGNDGGGRKYYPASYPNVISVAATDYNDKRASFSNFNDEIDISAPGVNVFSTFPIYEFTIGTKYGRSKNYDVGSGTSMSVPQVVGLAGLLFAQDSNRDKVKVRAIIEETADDRGVSGWDKYFGWGRINVNAALNYVPSVCGNGIKEGTEECDGTDLGGTTCESLGFTGGTLICTASCTLDTSGCIVPTCIVVPGECNCNGKCGPNETPACADCQ